MEQTFHKFRASTLEEAYLKMRSVLGDDAVVIRATSVNEGGFLGGLFAARMVELTASPSLPTISTPRPLSPVERKYVAMGSAKRGALPTSSDAVAATSVGSEARVRDTVDFFQKLIGEAKQRVGMAEVTRRVKKPPVTPMPTGELTPPIQPGNAVPAETIEFQPHEVPKRPESSMEEIREDLSDMREMLNVLSAEMPGATLPTEFMPHYRTLLERGVTRKRAATLVSKAASRGDLRAFREPRIFLERLKMEVRRQVKVTGGIALQAGQRQVVALVGPTGVGKTTNLAKLAALFSVRERARVAVITTDTYRVAATDQLKVYSDIIDLPMKVVHDAGEMLAALKEFKDHDLVLIDTAGGSPFNDTQLHEVKELLDAARPDEVHLLVGASTGLADLKTVTERFGIVKPTALFFTKLDETQRYGQLYCMAAEGALPLSYFSTGQNVPDDLRPAHAGMVANLIVEGADRRGRTSTEPS